MWEISLRWCGPADWHVRMFGADGRAMWITRNIEKWTEARRAGRDPWKIDWPGDPATAAECLAMAERVWDEQFGGAK